MKRLDLSSPDTILVFGSNQAGRHGKGAALFAKEVFAAKYGVGEGIQGRAYGIPTKDFNLNARLLPDIQVSVNKFLTFARNNSVKKFVITRTGCELAGYYDFQIAPMFKNAPSNCVLPLAWRTILEEKVTPTYLFAPEISYAEALYFMHQRNITGDILLATKENIKQGLHLHTQVGYPQDFETYVLLLSNFVDHFVFDSTKGKAYSMNPPVEMIDASKPAKVVQKARSVFQKVAIRTSNVKPVSP